MRPFAQVLAAILLALGLAHCSSTSSRGDSDLFGSGGKAAGGSSAASGGTQTSNGGSTVAVAGTTGTPDGCKGLACQKKVCPLGTSTTISGRIYDPSGKLPLYNVMAYVPNAPLAPFTPGANCLCEISGEPTAAGLSDTNGNFVIRDAPVGANIPLVIQIGKWRRTFTLPNVAECSNTTVPDGTLRLPAKQTEGDMPKVALTTGGADALECLLRKLGIDASEITNPDGSGRFNLFAGHDGSNRYESSLNGGASFPAAASVWSSVDSLKKYDLVLLSCEGGEFPEEKGDAAFKAMAAYTALGGRMFASHWQQVWLKSGAFPTIARYTGQADLGDLTADVITSFPKGKALSEWLVNVQASTTPGKLPISDAQHTIVEENPMYAQSWITSTSPQAVQYLSANTPMGAPPNMQCGRIVLSDLHVAGATGGGTDTSSPSFAFPSGCVTSGLSPQEKVLAFMLFDISACTIPDSKVPEPPVVK
ncbi:MAG: carboxypeptidase regulatory-like domain-containing protein [Myxococcota bacterium]